jgi:benzoyl-CoA reductase/2-hydroxyglutaryl-CoA dehydratase subunit BcrC/BadD/HgdB
VFGRIADIREQVALRRIDGLVHYVQSFCFRQIQDMLIRRAVDVPVLTIEADRPGPVDARTLVRIEAFVEMLQARAAR